MPGARRFTLGASCPVPRVCLILLAAAHRLAYTFPHGGEDANMRFAYFDCFAGAAGDMIVGALLDAGLELEALQEVVGTLELGGYSISADRVHRAGLAGTKFDVHVEQAEQPPRGLREVESIIDSGRLPGDSAEHAKAVFRRLAQAEAKVHGQQVEKVHFHEVGAVDSIVDIVAATAGLALLEVDEVHCSLIPLGSGTVQTAHGALPVPAPATAELLAGAPVTAGPGPTPGGELTTPTAAALLTTLARSFGPVPAMRLEAVGYGAGSRQAGEVPNLLRVLLGSADQAGQVDTVVELSANLDDCTGEVIAAALERLLRAGALDAWCTPIAMKKSRAGWMLSALCAPADVAKLEAILFAETTTLGVRRRVCRRSKLSRRWVTVETPYGPVRIKVGCQGQRELTASVEFADARRAAEAHGVPVKEVMAAALTAYRAAKSQGGKGMP